MKFGKDTIKAYVRGKTEDVVTKIERTPQERFFLVFLIVITLSAVVLGAFQFRTNIRGPFLGDYLKIRTAELVDEYAAKKKAQEASGVIEIDQAKITRLQGQDSDLDGLTDYSELYSYQTNAYSADTDGDGITDKQEILSGQDPLCAGENCASSSSASPDSTSYPPSSTGEPSSTGTGSAVAGPGYDVNLLSSNPEEILKIMDLIQSGQLTYEEIGVTSLEIKALFEKLFELKKIEDQMNSQGGVTPTTAVGSVGQSGTTVPSTTGSQLSGLPEMTAQEKEQMLALLSAYTPDQVRVELISQGMDPAMIAKIDDATLIQVFQQTLNSFK